MSQMISVLNITKIKSHFFLRISLANEEVEASLVMNF